MKECKHEGCKGKVFSKGECLFHAKIRYAKNRKKGYSKKRGLIEEKYRKAKKEKAQQRKVNICESCGCTTCGLDPSHIVRRSFSIALIAEPDNIVFECRACHEQTEAYEFFKQKNGLSKLEYLFKNAEELFWKAFFKYKENQELFKKSKLYDSARMEDKGKPKEAKKEQVRSKESALQGVKV